MKSNSIILIGPILLGGRSERGGDTMKNKTIYNRLMEVFDKVYAVDTYKWQRNPLVSVRLFLIVLMHPTTNIIVSANTMSANKIIRILRPLSNRRKVFYWVIGGAFHKLINSGVLKKEDYAYLNGIFVEGNSMVSDLQKCGLTNVRYCPNFKKINRLGERKRNNDTITHFVFLSRVEESKGTRAIIECIDKLNCAGYKGRYDVTFYGSPSKDPQYRKDFEMMIAAHEEAEYRGLLNLQDEKNYDTLADYDVMLFPTFWQGEGFPGIIIDAYISGLPIIASDWNLNSEIIRHNETGWIIPPRDNDSLLRAMIYAIEHPDELRRISSNCFRTAMSYDSNAVLSADNLIKWNILP